MGPPRMQPVDGDHLPAGSTVGNKMGHTATSQVGSSLGGDSFQGSFSSSRPTVAPSGPRALTPSRREKLPNKELDRVRQREPCQGSHPQAAQAVPRALQAGPSPLYGLLLQGGPRQTEFTYGNPGRRREHRNGLPP